MNLDSVAILLCLACLFGFINHRFLRLQPSVGLLVVSLATSIVLLAVAAQFPNLGIVQKAHLWLKPERLPQALFNGALAFMLFAGSLNLVWDDLWSRKATVLSLATVGVLISAGLYGIGMWLLLGWSGAWVPLSWCVVLGAILAPTDPIAVGAVMARVGLPPRLQAVIVGESLFNDGVGVVVFNSALGFALSPGDIGSGHIILEFLIETGGAVIIGLVTGWLGFELMRRVDEHILEITISLAVATGGYALAQAVDVSGPVTVVVSGLLIGSRGRQLAMSEDTAERFSAFWALIDELLNAILFIVIGLELFDITFGSVPTWLLVVAPLLAVVVRLIAVVATTRWLHAGTEQYWRRTGIVTWAGLRGGISVALALSLPYGVWTERILLVTYVVVVFSIIVQGLTMEWFARFIRVAQG